MCGFFDRWKWNEPSLVFMWYMPSYCCCGEFLCIICSVEYGVARVHGQCNWEQCIRFGYWVWIKWKQIHFSVISVYLSFIFCFLKFLLDDSSIRIEWTNQTQSLIYILSITDIWHPLRRKLDFPSTKFDTFNACSLFAINHTDYYSMII